MATTKAPRKNKKIKRPDLKIGIKDFGPIAEGEIELKPLTVFIGPNNSGKSYAAMLLNAIFNSNTPMSFSVNSAHIKFVIDKANTKENRPSKQTVKDTLQDGISEFEMRIDKLKPGDALIIPESIIQKIINGIIKRLNEDILGNMISQVYSTQLSDLIMIGKKSFFLSMTFNPYYVQLKCYKEQLNIREPIQMSQDYSKKYSNIEIKVTEEFDIFNKEKKNIRFSIILDGKTIMWSIDRETIPYSLIDFISQNCCLDIFGFMSCHYLPAVRSDKLQFYKLIGGNTFRQATAFGIDEQQAIPKLLGVVLDYISSIIEISPEKKGDYYEFAEELEKELLKGSIVFESADANLFPEAKYRFQGVDIPLQRASSSVSEIAPIILYLKYIVKPGSVLIIEEPEAHLHPGNIRILAKYLVRLVNKGVNVLITTHSEYLLEQLDNFVMLTNIDPEERVERYGYEKDDFIKHTDFAVYEFHYDQNTGTSKIEKARLTKKDGVSQDEFVKVFEELYEETGKLRRDLSDE